MLGGISEQYTSVTLNAWRHRRAEHVGEHVLLHMLRNRSMCQISIFDGESRGCSTRKLPRAARPQNQAAHEQIREQDDRVKVRITNRSPI